MLKAGRINQNLASEPILHDPSSPCVTRIQQDYIQSMCYPSLLCLSRMSRKAIYMSCFYLYHPSPNPKNSYTIPTHYHSSRYPCCPCPNSFRRSALPRSTNSISSETLSETFRMMVLVLLSARLTSPPAAEGGRFLHPVPTLRLLLLSRVGVLGRDCEW